MRLPDVIGISNQNKKFTSNVLGLPHFLFKSAFMEGHRVDSESGQLERDLCESKLRLRQAEALVCEAMHLGLTP